MLIAPRDERSDNPGQLAMVIRPRDSDSSLDDYAIDHYRPPFDPETALYGPSGEEEEVLEIKKDRRGRRTIRSSHTTAINIFNRSSLANPSAHACNHDLAFCSFLPAYDMFLLFLVTSYEFLS
jgi:hypothetical protein